MAAAAAAGWLCNEKRPEWTTAHDEQRQRRHNNQKDVWKKVDDKKEMGRRTLFTRVDHGRCDGVRIEMIAGDQRMMAIVGGELVISILCRMVI